MKMQKNLLGRGKVAIIGMGAVGSAAAYAFILNGCVSELVLIDVDKERAEGNALDLEHCEMFTQLTSIKSGDSYDLVGGADVVVITAGLAQKPGQTRLELLENNNQLLKEIVPKVVTVNKDCILLIVSNPLDIMTYAAWKYSGFDSCRVFGTGTVLDTARLRYLIGEQCRVSPKDVNAFVLGEHGDHSFVWWSKATIAGIALTSFTGYSLGFEKKIEEQVKNAAYQIINKKGSTSYAIGLVIVNIVRSILFNQPRVFTVSSIIHNQYGIDDVALSLPTIIRRDGVCEMLRCDLNNEELDYLHQAAEILKGIILKVIC